MFDRPHFYLTFGGVLYPAASGQEQWQTGLHFAAAPSATVGDFEDALDAISLVDVLEDATDLIKGVTQTVVDWSSIVGIDWAKVAIIGTDGNYAAPPKLAEQTGQFGIVASVPILPQAAAVVSLWSGDTFGRGNRGRAYLPLPSTAYNSITALDPRISTTQAAGIRDAWKLFMAAVAGEINTVGLPTYPAIMSSLGTGVTKPIIRVACGRVVDTMRSRRESLAEDKVWANYP